MRCVLIPTASPAVRCRNLPALATLVFILYGVVSKARKKAVGAALFGHRLNHVINIEF
jgi:hypothetical protein